MRVDKYLWCIRVFKTRSLAANSCKTEKVQVNNEVVKPSRELKRGDVIQVRKGPVYFKYEVIDFPKARLGAKLVSTVMKDVTDPAELAKLEVLKMQMKETPYYGIGRPTKRDRRALDDFMELDLDDNSEEDD